MDSGANAVQWTKFRERGTFAPFRSYKCAPGGQRAARPLRSLSTKNDGVASMALAHAIAEHLPYLRRYARALTGTQQSGDAYVRACLEAIVADTSVLGTDLPPRVALYRLFHKLWDTTNLDSRPVPG